jgi:lysophospholipase L1-like esterase
MMPRQIFHFAAVVFCAALLLIATTRAMGLVPADNPCIQYYGRWDMSDSLHPRFSWPGVYIITEFTGTRIGIRLDDHTNYYNVYIDGSLHSVFHGTQPGEADYVLADSLQNTRHTFLLSRRNTTFDEIYTFSGILLDSGATLLPPPPRSPRKIEFIGDSYTAGESDETTAQSLPWEARFPVTNIDKGFPVLIAKHFNAQYTTTCRSGSGMFCDWQGDTNQTIPKRFDRTFMDTAEPKWDFSKWVPNVVVICLGINDLAGLRGKDGNVSEEKSMSFRTAYHNFLATIRSVYPEVKIVAVASYQKWIQQNVAEVVDEEKAAGYSDIYYTHFDEFPGGYVGNGHPTVATHRKMADEIIDAMESFHLFSQ